MTENTDVPSEMIKEKKEYLLFRHRHRKRHKHDADCLLVFGAFRSRSAIVSPPMPEERKTEKSSLVITNARWSVNWNEKDEALWVYCRWNCFICDLWLYKGRFFCFFTVMHFVFYCEVSLRSTAPTGLGEVWAGLNRTSISGKCWKQTVSWSTKKSSSTSRFTKEIRTVMRLIFVN